jgi:parallel beta-helix repeat protein
MVIASLFVVSSCTNDEDLSVNNEAKISLIGQIELPTLRTTNQALNKDFLVKSKEAGVYVTDNSNEVMLYDNNKLTSDGKGNFSYATPMLYPASASVNIYAYAPFREGWKMTGANDFIVSSDQRAEDGYLSNDLLLGIPSANPVAKTSENVVLTFTHRLSKVNVNLIAGIGFPDLKGAKVNLLNVLPKTTFVPSTGAITIAEGAAVTIQVAEFPSDATIFKSSAIIVPQTIETGAKFIEVELSDGRKLYFTTKDPSVFESGKAYNYNITVNLTQQELSLLVVSSVVDWGATQPIEGEANEEASQKNKKYYVSASNGDDTNTLALALTKETPLATIQKALELISAGDTISIMNGTYKGKIKITKSLSGKVLNPTVLMSMEGETPVLDGEKPAPNVSVERWGAHLLIEGAEHIKIDGLKVQDIAWYGIDAENSGHITIENCATFNSGASGIYMRNCNNVLVKNNDIQKACQVTTRVSGMGTQECITLAAVHDFVVTGNEVSNSTVSKAAGGEGIDVKAGSYNGEISNNYIHDILPLGIYIDAGSKGEYNIRVFGNTLWKCDGIGVAGELGGTAKDIYIYNNIIREPSIVGLTLQDTGNGRFKNIYIVNNTFYNSDTSNGWGGAISNTARPKGYTAEITEANENIQIKNNIFYNDATSGYRHSIYLNDLPAHDISNNLYQTFKPGYNGAHNFTTANLTDKDILNLDPLFVDPQNGNFALQASSPAKMMGVPTYVGSTLLFTTDMKGNTRGISKWTMGAIE